MGPFALDESLCDTLVGAGDVWGDLYLLLGDMGQELHGDLRRVGEVKEAGPLSLDDAFVLLLRWLRVEDFPLATKLLA